MALRPSKDHTEAAAALAGLVDDRRPLHREDLPHQPGQVGQGPAEPPVVGVQDGLELLVAGPVVDEADHLPAPRGQDVARDVDDVDERQPAHVDPPDRPVLEPVGVEGVAAPSVRVLPTQHGHTARHEHASSSVPCRS
jgi:hypothetical protein